MSVFVCVKSVGQPDGDLYLYPIDRPMKLIIDTYCKANQRASAFLFTHKEAVHPTSTLRNLAGFAVEEYTLYEPDAHFFLDRLPDKCFDLYVV